MELTYIHLGVFVFKKHFSVWQWFSVCYSTLTIDLKQYVQCCFYLLQFISHSVSAVVLVRVSCESAVSSIGVYVFSFSFTILLSDRSFDQNVSWYVSACIPVVHSHPGADLIAIWLDMTRRMSVAPELRRWAGTYTGSLTESLAHYPWLYWKEFVDTGWCR